MNATILLIVLCAQATPGDKAVRRYMAEKAAELEKDFLPGIKTAADFEKARPALREAYLDMLGLRPLPPKTPLNVKITHRAEHEAFIVENLHYQSRPGLYVTANLYLPKAAGKHPAIFYSCGHSNMKRDGNKAAYQDHGIWFATHGYVCLVVDTLQLGEIAAIHHGTYREQRWWWHSRGYTPAGVECWNAIRGLDYLQSRPEVDPGRIGASGISGGGAATFWIAAADERIKVAVPVSGMADLGFYVAEDGTNGHCDCMFLYNSARWNWTAIAALVCPRPMLFTNSDADTIFPMSANDRVITRLERIYSKYGASDLVDAMVSVGGHAYREDLRRAAFEFFNRHLKGDSRRVDDAQSGLAPDGKRRLEPSTLRAFARDEDIPADQINTKIDETFVPEAKVALPEPEHFNVWRMALLEDLKKTSFGGWTGETLAMQSAASQEGTTIAYGALAGGLEISWRRVPGTDAGLPLWLIVLSQDENIDALPEWARSLVGNATSVLLRTRGVGPGSWTRKNPPNTVERSMALLGTTVDSGRVWDIMTVAKGGRWRAAGKGQAGILAAYAALYEPGIESVVLVGPPASHRAGPHFLSVLRVLDIPDALGCLAPRPLTLIGAKDPAFDRTAEVYRIAGSPSKLERKP